MVLADPQTIQLEHKAPFVTRGSANQTRRLGLLFCAVVSRNEVNQEDGADYIDSHAWLEIVIPAGRIRCLSSKDK